jgi:hypothetical protein
MESLMLELLLIMLLYCLPMIAAIISTIVRLAGMRRRRIPFSFHISDLLLSTLFIGTAAAVLHTTDIYPGFSPFIIAGVCAGLVAGKIWYLSSITKSFRCSSAYLILGMIFWTAATMSSGFVYAITHYRCCC